MFINQILTKLKSLVYSKSETDSLLNGKASSSHTHTKSQITDFPTIPSKVSQLTNDSGFITGVSWANVTGKPSTFTPSSHTHTKNQITDFPSLATVATSGSYTDLSNKPTIPSNTNQLTNGAGFITSSGSCSYSTTSGTSTYSTYLKSLGSQTPKSGRDIFHSGVYTYTTFTDTNTPAHYGAVIGYGNGQGGSCEVFAEWVGRGKLWFRVLRDCIDSWTDWQQIITSDNIGSQSVNYANSAGSVAWGNVSGRPWALSQFTNNSGFITSEIDSQSLGTSGWIRFKNGLQICWENGINRNSSGTLYSWNKAFSAVFVAIASDVGPDNGNASPHGSESVCIRTYSATQYRIGATSGDPNKANFWIQYIAIGKWK